MRRACWIAADLTRDALASGPFVALGLFLALWLPFQIGLIDGVGSRTGLLPAMRRSLVMNHSWGALAALGLHAQVLFPRRLKREMEPLLCAPVTDLEIVIGISLPVLVIAAASGPAVFGLNLLGFHLAAGRLPGDLAREAGRAVAGTLLAGTWLAAFGADAVLGAATQGAYLARIMLGYAALSALDLLLAAPALAGHPGLAAAARAGAAAAGVAAIALVARRLDRERLIASI